MDPEIAQTIARRVHAGRREEGGAPLLRHIGRVARAAPVDARAVAWLHEAVASGAVAEEALLTQGLDGDELRALRLLARTRDARSEAVYMAHVELIGRAAGRSGRLARAVKVADLEDRLRHPRVWPDGWSPPYRRALTLLLVAAAASAWAPPLRLSA